MGKGRVHVIYDEAELLQQIRQAIEREFFQVQGSSGGEQGLAAVFAELLTRAPEPVEQVDPGIPRELCRIVKTAMAREKKDRYARAAELAEEVDDYLKSLG